MVEGKSDLVRATEKRVREIFEAADHEVSEAVGERPGEVVFFAEDQRRTGRLRMHWTIWEQCPQDLTAALDALDQERARLGADRALAVTAQGSLPDGYRHDLHAQRVNVFTLRRFAFEMLGAFDLLRTAAAPAEDEPHHPDQFLPRRGVTERGDIVPAVEYIENLLDRGAPWLLLVEGENGVGRYTVLDHVAHRRACACLADLERGTPLLPAVAGVRSRRLPSVVSELLAFDVAWYMDKDEFEFLLRRDRMPPFQKIASAAGSQQDITKLPWMAEHPVLRLRLLAPEVDEIRAWYRGHLPQSASAQLEAAWERLPDIAAIAGRLANLSPVCKAAVQALEDSDTFQQWLARFIIGYATYTKDDWYQHLYAEQLEDGALEEFALGGSRGLAELLTSDNDMPITQWLEVDENEEEAGRFANRLIRDYFLARKIAREVRAHGPDIFVRYQFPQEHVLLFLAVLAPDVAAQTTADRSAELRARIQEEIEHQLQLTLAHQLRRSVGALRTNLGRVRRVLTDAAHAECSDDLKRIDEELAFLSALAEKTQRWHEVPEEQVEDISLRAIIDGVLSQLRDANAEVSIIRELAPDTLVRAGRHTLHEILYCLLENAFHAACDPAATQSPRVEVRAVLEGTDVVRIEVLDSGPGVDPGDRERIFKPRVTTKKGGPGRPLGTGMGLAIARKYAHAIGGRVEIDSERTQTCFVLKLVAGGMNRG